MVQRLPVCLLIVSTFTAGKIAGQNVAINITGNAAAATNMLEVTQSSTAANMVALYAIHNGANAAGQTGYGFQAIKTGAAGNNVAGYFSASGGANNYAIIVPSTGGRVGFGTSTPESILHIENGEAKITSYDNDAAISATRPAWQFGASGPGFTIRNTSDFAVFSDKLFIDYLGNVGIGITGPLEKLHIVGNTRISTLAGTGTRVVQADANGTMLPLAAGTATQVMLGTGVWGSVPGGSGNYIQNQYASAQTADYWISGESRTGSWFRNSASGTGLYNQANNAGIYSPSASLMSTYANSNFRIEGNLLIGNQGSASSYGSLTLRGEKNSWSGLSFQNSAGTLLGTFMVASNVHGFYNNTDNGWNYYWNGGAMQILNGYSPTNNVIRMTPNLHFNAVAGSAVILNWDNGAVAAATKQLRVGNGASTDVFDVYAHGGFAAGYGATAPPTGGAIISGNVGIGTSAPAYKLDMEVLASTTPGDSMYGMRLTDGTRYMIFHPGTVGAQSWNNIMKTHDNAIVYQPGGGFTIAPWTGGPSGLRIEGNSGLVGIGVHYLTAYSYKLQVNGTTACSGNVWSSDRRLKKNIQELKLEGLDIVKKLNPVTYEWNEVQDIGMEGTQMGFIAQQIEEFLPNMVLTAKDGTKGVKYIEMLPILVKAIQEQQKIIDKQQSGMEAIKLENQQMKAEVTELKNSMELLLKQAGAKAEK